MTFQDDLRRRTGSALEALRDRSASTLRGELDLLRGELESRMAALERALAQRDDTEVVDALVQELSRAAAEEADALVARARADTEQQARDLVADAHRSLEAERGVNVELTAHLDAAQQQIGALQESAQAHARISSELEGRLAHEQATNAEVSRALASLQASASLAHDEAQGREADFEAVRSRVHALEEECRQLRDARDESGPRMRAEGPSGDAAALGERVKLALRAFTGATNAQAIFDTLVAQLATEFGIVALFLHRRNRLEGWRSCGLDSQTNIGNVVVPLSIDSPLARAVNTKDTVTIEPDAAGAKLGVFGKEVADATAWPVVVSGSVVAVAYVEEPAGRLDGAGFQSRQIAEILVEHVGRCLVMGRRAAAEPASAAQETAADPAASKAPEAPEATTRRPSPGPAEPLREAAAVERRATAEAVETKEAQAADRRPAARPAPAVHKPAADSSLLDGLNSNPRTSFAGPAREVDRIRIRSGVDVSVDGTTGQLIDLSTRGAQVMSPRPLRPQQLVRIVLPGADGSITCKGRIMWARFEKSRPTDPGMYRAGVKFSEADPVALQTFLDEYAEQVLDLPARAG